MLRRLSAAIIYAAGARGISFVGGSLCTVGDSDRADPQPFLDQSRFRGPWPIPSPVLWWPPAVAGVGDEDGREEATSAPLTFVGLATAVPLI